MDSPRPQLVIDKKGKAHLPTGYKPTEAEKQVIYRGMGLSALAGLGYGSASYNFLQFGLSKYSAHRNPRHFHVIAGSLSMYGGICMFMLLFRGNLLKLMALEDSLLADLCTHNKGMGAFAILGPKPNKSGP